MFRRRRPSIPAALAGLALVGVPNAYADPAPGTCEYDATTKTATYAWPSSYQSSDIPLIQRVGDDIKVGRSTSRDCPGATAANTDVIRILGSPPNATASNPDDIVLAPHTPLITPGGAAIKVEFVGVAAARKVRLRVNGTTGRDAVVAGQLGVNFNADEPTPDVDLYVLDGADKRAGGIQPSNMGCSTSLCSELSDPGTTGNDFLSTQGGFGTGGAAYQGTLSNAVLLGGEGEDHLAATNWTDVIGGPGNDDLDGPGTPDNRARVRFDSATGPIRVDLAVATPQSTGQGTDTITGFGAAMGGKFADELYGNDDENGLDGGSLLDDANGGDHIEGRGGDDILSGGPGNDTLLGGPGEDTLDGSSGDDDLDGGADDDSLTGDVGTGAGQDGDDILKGGPGDDRLLPARGTDVVDGGPGSDTISFAYLLTGVTYDMAVHTQQNTGGGGMLTATGVENVSTSEYTDTIFGDDGPNRVTGLGDHWSTPKPPNHDAVHLRGGDDYLSAFSPTQGVTVYGGPGNDTVWGSRGPDVIDGGPGADSVWARDGDDTLTGPAEGVKDTLRCEEGNDTVTSYDDGLDVLEECEIGTPGTPPAPAPAPVAPVAVPAAPAVVPVAPASTPPVTPAPAPTATPVKKLPSSLLDIPKSSTKTCLSRRSFTITLKQKKGVVYQRAVVTLKAGKKEIVRKLKPKTVRVKVKSKKKSKTGKRKTRTVKKTQVKVNLKGLPKGKFSVEIEVTAKDGAVLTGKRTYRTCTPKRTSKKKSKL